jgi:hypothetical protein
MKMIFAGVAFATLMAAPVFAQPQRYEGLLASGIYQPAQKSNQPKSNFDPMEQWPCSTAHDFCPGYHGDNS